MDVPEAKVSQMRNLANRIERMEESILLLGRMLQKAKRRGDVRKIELLEVVTPFVAERLERLRKREESVSNSTQQTLRAALKRERDMKTFTQIENMKKILNSQLFNADDYTQTESNSSRSSCTDGSSSRSSSQPNPAIFYNQNVARRRDSHSHRSTSQKKKKKTDKSKRRKSKERNKIKSALRPPEYLMAGFGMREGFAQHAHHVAQPGMVPLGYSYSTHVDPYNVNTYGGMPLQYGNFHQHHHHHYHHHQHQHHHHHHHQHHQYHQPVVPQHVAYPSQPPPLPAPAGVVNPYAHLQQQHPQQQQHQQHQQQHQHQQHQQQHQQQQHQQQQHQQLHQQQQLQHQQQQWYPPGQVAAAQLSSSDLHNQIDQQFGLIPQPVQNATPTAMATVPSATMGAESINVVESVANSQMIGGSPQMAVSIPPVDRVEKRMSAAAVVPVTEVASPPKVERISDYSKSPSLEAPRCSPVEPTHPLDKQPYNVIKGIQNTVVANCLHLLFQSLLRSRDETEIFNLPYNEASDKKWRSRKRLIDTLKVGMPSKIDSIDIEPGLKSHTATELLRYYNEGTGPCLPYENRFRELLLVSPNRSCIAAMGMDASTVAILNSLLNYISDVKCSGVITRNLAQSFAPNWSGGDIDSLAEAFGRLAPDKQEVVKLLPPTAPSSVAGSSHSIQNVKSQRSTTQRIVQAAVREDLFDDNDEDDDFMGGMRMFDFSKSTRKKKPPPTAALSSSSQGKQSDRSFDFDDY